VISQEVWMDVKLLNRQGMSIRAIARHTGLARTTVRRLLTQTVPKRYGPRPPRPSKIDPFVDYLRSALELRPWVRATTLHQEIVAKGFTGHYEMVKCWVRTRRAAAAARARATVRFETAPGVEGQFDWKGHITGLLESDPHQKVWIFRFVLAYSRFRVTRAVTTTTLPAVLSDLRDVFELLGQVPRRLVFDNFKAAVLSPRPNLRLHPVFADFCLHYSVEPAPALIYSPERKGKTERGFLDLEHTDLIHRTYTDLATLQRALDEEDLRYHARVHSTTGQTPADRFQREAAFLLPLPEAHFDTRLPETRRVLSDCVISYGGAYYSVPYRLVGTKVTVKADARRPVIDIYDADALVASHALVAKGERVLVEEHVAELRRPRWDRVRAHATHAPAPETAPELPQLVKWTPLTVPLRPIEEYARALEVQP
jgi:transposase